MSFTLADLRRIRDEARKIEGCPTHTGQHWKGIHKDRACDHAGFCDDCTDILIVALACVVNGEAPDAAIEEQRKLALPTDFKMPAPPPEPKKEWKGKKGERPAPPPPAKGTEIPL